MHIPTRSHRPVRNLGETGKPPESGRLRYLAEGRAAQRLDLTNVRPTPHVPGLHVHVGALHSPQRHVLMRLPPSAATAAPSAPSATRRARATTLSRACHPARRTRAALLEGPRATGREHASRSGRRLPLLWSPRSSLAPSRCSASRRSSALSRASRHAPQCARDRTPARARARSRCGRHGSAGTHGSPRARQSAAAARDNGIQRGAAPSRNRWRGH